MKIDPPSAAPDLSANRIWRRLSRLILLFAAVLPAAAWSQSANVPGPGFENIARPASDLGRMISGANGYQETYPSMADFDGDGIKEGVTYAQGVFAGDIGRTTAIGVHRGFLVVAPEAPGSDPGSSFSWRVFDISDPTAPVEVVRWGGTAAFNMHGYAVDRWEFNRLRVFDDGTYGINNEFGPVNGEIVSEPDNDAPSTGGVRPGDVAPGTNTWSLGGRQENWAFTFQWEQYGGAEDPYRIAKIEEDPADPGSYTWVHKASWNHIAESGVSGIPVLIGNILIYASDDTQRGVAAYDISDPTNPVLLDVVRSGGGLKVGGYLPEVWKGHVVLPSRKDGGYVHFVNYSDPTTLTLDASIPVDVNPAYVQFQDEFAFAGNAKLDLRPLENAENDHDPTTPAGNPLIILELDNDLDDATLGHDTYSLGERGTQGPWWGVNTNQHLCPVGNLLVTGGITNGNGSQGAAIWVHDVYPDTPEIEPDLRGPEINYHIPFDGHELYSIECPITLLIHESVDTYNFEPGSTVFIREASTPETDLTTEDVSYEYIYSDLLTLTPKDGKWDPGTTYEVIITKDAINDAVGNYLEIQLDAGDPTTINGKDIAYYFTFTTADGTNALPVLSAASGIDGGASPFELDGNREVTVNFRLEASDAEDSLEYRIRYGETDANGNQYAYPWTPSGGQQMFSHTYTKPGNYKVLLQVREIHANNLTRVASKVVNLVVTEPIIAGTPRQSSPIAIDEVNRNVWMVNPDADTVTQMDADASSNTIVEEYSVDGGASEPAHPVSVAVDALGRAWVACRDADSVVVFSPGNANPVASFEIGYGSRPVGTVSSPDGNTIYVSEEGRSGVLRFDASLAVPAYLDMVKVGAGDTTNLAGGLQYRLQFPAAGDFSDSSGMANPAAVPSGSVSTDSTSYEGGFAADFPGSGGEDYLELPSALLDSSAGTAAGWIKVAPGAHGSQSSGGPIFYGGNASNGFGGSGEQYIHIHVDRGGELEAFFNDGSTDIRLQGPDVEDDAWHHVAVTWDASTGSFALYLDGAAIATDDLSGTAAFGFPVMVAGKHGQLGVSWKRNFTGLLDDLRLYDRALSGAEVFALSDQTVKPKLGAMAVTPDGQKMLVNEFISRGQEGGAVWEIDLGEFKSASQVTLPKDASSNDNSFGGRGIPNYLQSIGVSPSGNRAWYSSKKDNIFRGEFLDGQTPDFETTVRALVGPIDLSGATGENIGERIDIDNHAMPSFVTFDKTGTKLFVAMLDHNRINVIDAYTRTTMEQADVGLAPQGIAIDSATGRVWVANFMGRSATVFEGATLIATGEASLGQISPLTIDTVGSEPLATDVLRGKQLFYSARNIDGGTEDENPSFASLDGYISCAACHLDGGQDGRNWDFTNRGEGIRNTISLRGREGTGHGNVHWTGNFDEIEDFALDIVNHFRGLAGLDLDASGDIDETEAPNPSLGAANNGLSQIMDDIAAYVSSLGEEHYEKSPYREAGTGNMTEAALRGKELFLGTTSPQAGTPINCVACHDPALAYTNSALGAIDPATDLFDVGTLKPTTGSGESEVLGASGKRLGQTLIGIDTPTLLGIHAAAPYLHDGSAKTIDAVFEQVNAGGAHDIGSTGYNLTVDERSDLIAFLEQLDGRPASPGGTTTVLLIGDEDGTASIDPGTDDLATVADPAWATEVENAHGHQTVALDTRSQNNWEAFTFTFAVGEGVTSATLELGLVAESTPWASPNDDLYIDGLGGANKYELETDLGWTAVENTLTVLTIDLADVDGDNLLALLADGQLNLAVHDDTAVDYARLTITTAGSGGENPGGGQTLLTEDFSGDLSGWTHAAGADNWSISGGELSYVGNVAGPNILVSNATGSGDWDDYTVKAKLRSGDDDPIGVVFYYQDANNYYVFDMTKTYDGGLVRRVSKVVGDSRTVLASETFTYTENLDYEVEVSVTNGGSLSVSFGESGGTLSEIFNVSTPGDLTSGTVGFYNRYNKPSSYDDISVTEN